MKTIIGDGERYLKQGLVKWAQPRLEGNGSMGGNSFAVSNWLPFYGTYDNGHCASYYCDECCGWWSIQMYIPVKVILKHMYVYHITINNDNGRCYVGPIRVYGAIYNQTGWNLMYQHDGDKWGYSPWWGNSTAPWDCDMSGNTTEWNYFNLEFRNGCGSYQDRVTICHIELDAYTQGTMSGTKEDHSIVQPCHTYKCLYKNGKYYG